MPKVRQNLGILVSKEELDSAKLIRNRLSCADQMLKTIPDGIDQETMDKYIQSVVEAKSEADWLQEIWWEKVKALYDIREIVYVDYSDGSLFTYRED
jgi:hypothetical protein